MAKDITGELEPGEVVVRDGWGNHFVGTSGDTGHMFLTNRRIIFWPHRLNFYGIGGSWPVAEIEGFIRGRVPTGLTVLFVNGKKERFAVWHRNQWIKEIEAVRHTLRGDGTGQTGTS